MKLAPLALAAVAALSACSMTPPKSNTPNIVTNTTYQLNPGSGVVQSVTPTPVIAGASQGESTQRLEVKMSDGKVQYIDTRSREIAKGDRIQISADGLFTKV
jgi:ABC-type uncharacterized transport system auxiliary subunit